MKSGIVSLRHASVALLFIIGAASGQDSTPVLPDGVRIPVVVIEDLVLNHLSKGDRVRFRVTGNLIGPNKQVVVPKDAIAIARVKDLRLYAKGTPSKICLLFEEITWKRGNLKVRAFVDGPITLPWETTLKNPGNYSPDSMKGRDFSPSSLEVSVESKPDSCPAIINAHANMWLLARTTMFIKQMATVPDELRATAP